VIRIARHLGLVNAFLVEEDDGFMLIDTTMDPGAAMDPAIARAS
jgi:hypothetical protein